MIEEVFIILYINIVYSDKTIFSFVFSQILYPVYMSFSNVTSFAIFFLFIFVVSSVVVFPSLNTNKCYVKKEKKANGGELDGSR